MEALIVSVVLDLGGLVLIWFLLKARVARILEIDGLLAEARKEARLLSIEINETTDRNITLVEDRLEALRDLLAEADRRMGVMKRETGRRQAETEVYSRLGRRVPMRSGLGAEEGRAEAGVSAGLASAAPGPAPFADRGPSPASRETAEPYLPEAPRAEEPVPLALVGAEAVPLSLGPRLPEVLTSPTSVIPPRSLRERAIELHRSGFSADIIAARLGATISEIELLVSLEEGREGGGGAGAP